MNGTVLLTALVLFAIGVAFLFAGYRLFRLLIPIWGFIVGFNLADIVERGALHSQPLSTLTDWIIAIVVGLLFAALAYAYYYISVVVLGVSVGYVLGTTVATTLSPLATGTTVLIAGVAGAVLVAVLVIAFDLPKTLIVVLTALGGAAATVVGVMLAFGWLSLATLQAGIAGEMAQTALSSPSIRLITLVLALVGMAAQAGRLRAAPYTHAYAQRMPRRATYEHAPTRTPPATPIA